MIVKLPLNEFKGQGIAVFTLYDENMLPVSERLVYVHPQKKLYITAQTDEKLYPTRSKGEIKIKVTDENGQPVIAHLGLSVHDVAYTNFDNPENILTHTYLSSQVKGKIYDPAYYFDENNPDRMVAMDLLLLTQGWRRYVWEENNLFLLPKGEEVVSDGFTGTQTVKSKEHRNTVQLLQLLDKDENYLFIEVDSAGRFSIGADQLRAMQSGYLYIKSMIPKDFEPVIKVGDVFSDIHKVRQMKKIVPSLAKEMKDTMEILPLITSPDAIALDEITVTAKAERPNLNKYMGRLDSLLRIDLDPWVDDWGFLENYRDDWSWYTPPQNSRYTKKNRPVEGQRYTLVKYELNGEGRWIVAGQELDVIYHGPYYSEEELVRKNNLWKITSYYGKREFYQPDEIDILSALPDVRNTLLWAPSIITDANGEATVPFYCSDINTRFTGQIEGIGDYGLIGTASFEFRVMKNTFNIGTEE
jgi:hypothetical protein